MKKIKKILTIFVITLFCCGVCSGTVYFKTKEYYQTKAKSVPIINKVELPNENIIDRDVAISGEAIQSGLHTIGKLCTAEYYYTHVEHFETSKKINGVKIPLTSSEFIYSYEGKIFAGIDFRQITVDKDNNRKRITITLPDAEIISADVDPDSFQLYDEKNNIFNPISVTDVAVSFADLKKNEEEKAIASGLYNRAEINAALLIETFMKSSYDFEDYKMIITFQEH